MGTNAVSTKSKKLAQRKAGAGWNQHVDKRTKRTANKVMRRAVKEGRD